MRTPFLVIAINSGKSFRIALNYLDCLNQETRRELFLAIPGNSGNSNQLESNYLNCLELPDLAAAWVPNQIIQSNSGNSKQFR